MSDWKVASAMALFVFCASSDADAQSPPNPAGTSASSKSAFPNVSSISPQNAAGLLGYCVKNKYLPAARANAVFSDLMKKPDTATSSGYLLGQKGHIISGHRGPMVFTEIPQELKAQACETVLKRGTILTQQQPAVLNRPKSAGK